jgi:uncharacterized protein
MTEIEEKIIGLKDWFANRTSVLIALSGGVDSCLVAFLARKWLGRENAVAVISDSASLKTKDLDDAKKFCLAYDIKLDIIDAHEIDDPNYASNPIDRCYYCKTALYDEIYHLAGQKYTGFSILNGNNFSDLGDYRPGLEAAKEHEVLSPLSECKLTKPDIRAIAAHFDMFIWNKPASPCLSSRVPYGESITREKLRMIEEAENVLNDFGFEDVRVRYMSGEARIEVPGDQISKLDTSIGKIAILIKEIGFHKVTVDEEGLVSGKLNRAINKSNVKLQS